MTFLIGVFPKKPKKTGTIKLGVREGFGGLKPLTKYVYHSNEESLIPFFTQPNNFISESHETSEMILSILIQNINEASKFIDLLD